VKQRAFTLIELLVVIAILSVLVAMLLPTAYRVRAMARTAVCASNLRQIGLAFSTYKVTYRNYLPPVCSGTFTLPGSDWDLAKNYGMWTALGAFVGLPEWGGVKDPATAPPGTIDDAYTGYLKYSSYWGKTQGGGIKFRRSIFMCPQTVGYGEDCIGAFWMSGYGESVYLQSYPSGWGSHPATGKPGMTSAAGLPRPASAIKNPSAAVQVGEKGGNGHSNYYSWLPKASEMIISTYPPSDRGTPETQYDLYRHNGGSNVLFADGHVAYYKGTDFLKNIVIDPDQYSMRNFQLP
jgi:prepilin-type N-terminal cleavage/methylation domain-containing protein/prepilin-type processing-associated H-X9-DG protein